MNQRIVVLLLGLTLSLFCGLTAQAQDPNYVLSITSTEGFVGGNATVTTSVDNTAGEDLNGWSYGICHDTAVLSVGDIALNQSVLDALGYVDDGDFGFYQVNILTEGWTLGVVIDLFGQVVLTPSVVDINDATYAIAGDAPEGPTLLDYCETLGGPPPVAVVVVIGGGTSVPPVTNGGSINVGTVPDVFGYYVNAHAAVEYDGAGAASFSMTLSCDEDPTGPLFPQDTAGFSMGLDGDDALLVATGVDPGPLETVLGLAPGDLGFFGPATFDGDMTVGIVYDLFGLIVLPFTSRIDVVNVSYDLTGSLAGDEVGATANLVWSDALTPPGGSQPVANVMVVAGQSFPVIFHDGSVDLVPQPPVQDFIRGDANDDGIVNIADGIWILNHLFQGGGASNCQDAADANGQGDGEDSSDAIYIFNYRFTGGSPPPAPFPGCGNIGEPQDCAGHNSCP